MTLKFISIKMAKLLKQVMDVRKVIRQFIINIGKLSYFNIWTFNIFFFSHKPNFETI